MPLLRSVPFHLISLLLLRRLNNLLCYFSICEYTCVFDEWMEFGMCQWVDE